MSTKNPEVEALHTLADRVAIYLVIVGIASFGLGYWSIESADRMLRLFAISLIGFSGSAVSAFTSCMDRHAIGLELEDGTKIPLAAQGETFNRRISRWLIFRPFLGLTIAPVLISGISFFVKDPQPFQASPDSLAFTAFIGGLLAKSIIELIKNLFKNVFRA